MFKKDLPFKKNGTFISRVPQLADVIPLFTAGWPNEAE